MELFGSYLTHLGLLKQENRTFTERRKSQKTRIVNLTLPELVYWFCDKAQNYFCYDRSLQKLSIGSAVMANRKVKALNQDSNPLLRCDSNCSSRDHDLRWLVFYCSAQLLACTVYYLPIHECATKTSSCTLKVKFWTIFCLITVHDWSNF